MAQSLSLPSWMKTAIDYLFRKKEPAFLTLTIHDILWGYQDPVLHYAKMFDKAHFTTDIVGAMAGVSACAVFLVFIDAVLHFM